MEDVWVFGVYNQVIKTSFLHCLYLNKAAQVECECGNLSTLIIEGFILIWSCRTGQLF